MSTVDAVLTEVREVGPATAAAIADSAGLSERAVRRALERLEEQGLVETEIYQRRARVFMATEEGA
jgi:predicted ArsR family transcriptional regulator